MADGFYSVKMRASTGGKHVSGAERIVSPKDISPTVAALARRALSHERGVPDSINIKVEAQRGVKRIKALEVVTETVPDAEAGWRKVEEILLEAGFARTKEICGLFSETYPMRGAMLLDADTLERLEPDRERGIRATNMDSRPSPPADRKNHFAEALALASKVLSAPGIVGEICVSDDPCYTTGYVAALGKYRRITAMKEKGAETGGRIFLYRGPREAVAETIRYLEHEVVVVETGPAEKSPRRALLKEELSKVAAAGLWRETKVAPRNIASFASNDYLSLATEPRVKEAARKAAAEFGAGAGASRLLTGTLPPHIALERHIAAFKGTEDAIVYPTGYMANVGAISAMVGKGDAILSDELNHASIIDGCRLSGAETIVYPHLDMDALDRLLGEVSWARRVLVVSDGVFSMDGDILDLPRFLETCARHDAFSMVDEAHATGVVGKTGRGLCELFGCRKPDISMGTLSKALGSTGGYVAGDGEVVECLRQKSRPFIFTTAPTPAAVAAADEALAVVEEEPWRVDALKRNIKLFADALGDLAPEETHGERTAIFPIPAGDERRAVEVSKELLDEGFLVPAIRYPTVAKGRARLRVAVNAGHDAGLLRRLATVLAEKLKLNR